MSLLNQPSRLVISGDDSEWSNNASTGGQTINLTLPEAVVGAMGVDCARAVIPNTQYPIPTYQNTFYYSLGGVSNTVVLTNNRNFTSVSDLITQLNSDAIAQGRPVVFTYDNTTCRVSTTIGDSTPYITIVAGINNTVQVTREFPAGTYTTRRTNLNPGVYTVPQFEAIVNFAFNQVCLAVNPLYNSGTATINGSNVITFSLGANDANTFLDFSTNYTAQQTAAMQLLYGLTTSVNYGFNTGSVTGNQPINAVVLTAVITPKSSWPSKFALNTRLGYANVGASGSAGTAIVGTFLPNILRTRVIYLLCNISVNDSISTDGLRTVLAKMPVNSSFGGLTIYEQKDYNYCRIVQSSYQNVQISLLDDNYEPYELTIEEPMEVELVFSYSDVRNE